MDRAREAVTVDEVRETYGALRYEVEQIHPDDIDSTGEAPPITADEAAAVLRRREQRTPPGGLAKLARLVAMLPLLFLSGCGLTAAQWESIAADGVKLACGAVVDFIPPSDAAIAAKVCTGLGALEPLVKGAIDAAAGEAKAQPAAMVQPQGEAPPRAVQCLGRNVAVVPARVAWRAQARLDAQPECAK